MMIASAPPLATTRERDHDVSSVSTLPGFFMWGADNAQDKYKPSCEGGAPDAGARRPPWDLASPLNLTLKVRPDRSQAASHRLT